MSKIPGTAILPGLFQTGVQRCALGTSRSCLPFAATSTGLLASVFDRRRQLLQADRPRGKVSKTAKIFGQKAAKLFQIPDTGGKDVAKVEGMVTRVTWRNLRRKNAPKAISEGSNFFTYKPTHASLRWVKRVNRSHLSFTCKKALSTRKIQKAGRNNQGRITVRHRGGGSRRLLRTVDFYRRDPGPLVVKSLVHDPNRTAWLALMENPETGASYYMIAVHGMKPGDVIRSWRKAVDPTPSDLPLAKDSKFVFKPEDLNDMETFSLGNALPLKFMPPNTKVHNIALHPLGKAILCRGAGTFGTVVKQDPNKGLTSVQLQSSEVRVIRHDCIATIGQVCNVRHQDERYGNAGVRRRLGWRPHVKGKAMNRCEHPHGGGRGLRKTFARGMPMSPWGAVILKKTRKTSACHVVKPRVRGEDKKLKRGVHLKRTGLRVYRAEGRLSQEEIHAEKLKLLKKK